MDINWTPVFHWCVLLLELICCLGYIVVCRSFNEKDATLVLLSLLTVDEDSVALGSDNTRYFRKHVPVLLSNVAVIATQC